MNAKRYDIHKKCAGKSGCTCLKIHALLVVMEIKAKYDSVAMTEHSKEIDDLLTESTDVRRIDTRKHHSCHGIHYPLDVVMAYNDAKRSLEHPFFTRSICSKIIQTMVDKLDRYMHSCIVRDRIAWSTQCTKAIELNPNVPRLPFNEHGEINHNLTGNLKLKFTTGEHFVVIPLFGKTPVVRSIPTAQREAGTIRQRSKSPEPSDPSGSQSYTEEDDTGLDPMRFPSQP